ncbi:hypothetical protein EYM_00910 [Ignicoccus islandicus DSM 13165]|uniref:Rossmann fold nucleotide-binding protein n=1 Tax=Ignicoccus islandicus DSM 13165 TaxID=940295 RepID=A0A0U3FHP6_9CREN|nr:hypothetical protein [Ignicoccus islandicus]ALU11430.1 hypothetical protein EYM_00910 [Ignicoccus islandicus DSM 13165]
MRIAVAACGCDGPKELAKEVAEAASILNLELALGGCWGLMGEVVREALERGVKVKVFLPIGAECPFPVDVIETNMSPNVRSALLVTSSNGLLALGGGAGTLMEVLMAYRERKPVALIEGWGMDTDPFFSLIKERGIDSRNLSDVASFNKPLEALSWLYERLKCKI